VPVQDGEVVTVPAVDDADAAVARRQPPREDGDEGGGNHYLHTQRLITNIQALFSVSDPGSGTG